MISSRWIPKNIHPHHHKHILFLVIVTIAILHMVVTNAMIPITKKMITVTTTATTRASWSMISPMYEKFRYSTCRNTFQQLQDTHSSFIIPSANKIRRIHHHPTFTYSKHNFHYRRQNGKRSFFWSVNSSSQGNESTENKNKNSKSNDPAIITTTTTKDSTDTEDSTSTGKTITSTWNISGLRNEMFRRIDRLHKKIGQYNKRIEKYNSDVLETSTTIQSVNEQIDIDAVKVELSNAQETLKRLRELDESLSNSISNSRRDMILPEAIAIQALALNMTDTPPPRPPRGEPKPKGPRKMEASRKPYRTYTSIDNIEIRVGKKAEDNDELSTNPQHRDSTDWWLHAAGCPGSHVIIRNNDPPDGTIQDAAALAANKSKCTGNIIKVNMCLARHVKKPPMAKPGLVMLQGNVRTVTVDMKAAQKRLERLETSVEVN